MLMRQKLRYGGMEGYWKHTEATHKTKLPKRSLYIAHSCWCYFVVLKV